MPLADRAAIYEVTRKALAAIDSGELSLPPEVREYLKKFVREYQAAGHSLDRMLQDSSEPIRAAIQSSALAQKNIAAHLARAPRVPQAPQAPQAPSEQLLSLVKVTHENHLLLLIQQQLKLVVDNAANLDQTGLQDTIFPRFDHIEAAVAEQQKALRLANAHAPQTPYPFTEEQLALRREQHAMAVATMEEFHKNTTAPKPANTM